MDETRYPLFLPMLINTNSYIGGYAEYTAVPAERVVKVPSGLDKQSVIGSFLMGMTALSLVKEAYEVKKGDKILIHAAAGGVGLLLCQILNDIGATVVGTASTAEKCELAKKNGAHHMINYKDNADWVAELKKIFPDGVDCVYDSVGKTTWEASLEAVKRKGHVIYFGNASKFSSTSYLLFISDAELPQAVPFHHSTSRNWLRRTQRSCVPH